MTKKDLVTRIAADTGLKQSDVFQVVQRTLDILSTELAGGQSIELRNFGVFDVCVRKSRVGRNPARPHIKVHIPERVSIRFRPGKELRNRLSMLQPGHVRGQCG